MSVVELRTQISKERIRKSIFRVLRENVLCSIATVAPQNRAHINTAYFAYSRDLELYFLSDPESLHCRNLAKNRSAAIAVFRTSQEWGGSDRGIQFFGSCQRIRGHQAHVAEEAYAKRFRSYAKWIEGRSEEDRRRAAAMRSLVFYRVLPSRVKILDETEFGSGVFVTAKIQRKRGQKNLKERTVVTWHSTERIGPDEESP